MAARNPCGYDRRMISVLSLLIALLSNTQVRPRVEMEACTQWRGTVRGNDPNVSVTATLCPAGDKRVKGTLVWESKTSGSSTRELEGAWSGKSLVLRDVALTGKPNPGWMFCKVDRYRLAQIGDAKLEGTYHSSACSDDATIKLERVR